MTASFSDGGPPDGGSPSFSFSVDSFPIDHFIVRRFTGVESISEPWAFDVAVSSSGVAGDEEIERVSLGQKAIFTWSFGGGERTFYGVIDGAKLRGVRTAANQTDWEFRIAPRLATLKRKRRSRIFQNMRVMDVVSSVLLEEGIASTWQLMREYPVREYCTQFEETDYRFVTRLLAEAGIFYYFAQGPRIDGDAQTAATVVGAVGAVGGALVGSFASSAGGALLSSSAAAAMPIVPGDTVIASDDATFYPPLGPDDAKQLAATSVVALAPQAGSAIGEAMGGMSEAVGTVAAGATALTGAMIGALSRSDAPVLHYLEMLGTPLSRHHKVTRFVLRTRLRTNSAHYRDYDPERPMTRLDSQSLSNSPFPSSALESAAQALAPAGTALDQMVGGVAGDVAKGVAKYASTAANIAGDVVGEPLPPILERYEHHGPFLF